MLDPPVAFLIMVVRSLPREGFDATRVADRLTEPVEFFAGATMISYASTPILGA